MRNPALTVPYNIPFEEQTAQENKKRRFTK